MKKKIVYVVGILAGLLLLFGGLCIAIDCGKQDNAAIQQTTDSEDPESHTYHACNIQVLANEDLLSSQTIYAPENFTVYMLICDNEDYVIDDGMITSIMGVEQDPANGEYWMIKVDGEYASTGVYDLKVDHDMRVTFVKERPVW